MDGGKVKFIMCIYEQSILNYRWESFYVYSTRQTANVSIG
jgi:hypothetical protein